MKKSLLYLIAILPVFLLSGNTFANPAKTNPITIKLDYGAGKDQKLPDIKNPPADAVLSLSVANIKTQADFDNFMNKTSIEVTSNGKPTKYKLADIIKQRDAEYETTIGKKAIAAKAINALNIDLAGDLKLQEKDQLKITAQVKAGTLPSFSFTAAASADEKGKSSADTTADNNSGEDDDTSKTLDEYLASTSATKDDVDLGSVYNNPSRYDKDGNKAYLIVDQNGELIGNYPVNIDQDDIIYVIIVGKKSVISKYTVDFTGTYSPVDLQMRTFTPVRSEFTPSAKIPDSDWDFIVKKRGPFTSANVVIKIKKSTTAGDALATYTMNVNTLFHLGFGVSFNRTTLENPSYRVTPINSTTNTISKYNGGQRNIVSFNVIWYWSSTVKYLLRGDNITRGRDVLKEPSFIERINPTFGVSFDKSITDNMFAGLTFEFARGGSLVGGYHFGKVNRLSMPNFVLGTTPFTGADADIKTSQESQRGGFFGLILDTRIFNALFKHGQ